MAPENPYSEDSTAVEEPDLTRAWVRTARAKLRFELAGLAFAVRHGFTPEEYARELWGRGGTGWIGKKNPTAAEYILKEVEAVKALTPEIKFQMEQLGDDVARLRFVVGCLGGYGKSRWGTALSLGLTPPQVCSYCQESFQVWTGPLSVEARPQIQPDETCVFTVRRRAPGS